jgi:hypothetical protein
MRQAGHAVMSSAKIKPAAAGSTRPSPDGYSELEPTPMRQAGHAVMSSAKIKPAAAGSTRPSPDGYFELAPRYWRITRARIDRAELDREIGWLTIPELPLPTMLPSDTLVSARSDVRRRGQHTPSRPDGSQALWPYAVRGIINASH